MFAQWITASLLFFILDIRLTSFYGLFGDDQFPVLVSYLVTVFTVTIITNSLNLIDGVDGLAGTFSLVACFVFGGWFLFTGDYPYALFCLALAGAVLAFLFQNWEPSNIFMGDTGSMVIGSLLSMVVIRFINENHELSADHPLKFNASIGTAICVIIIPLVDTVRIITIRLSNGISPLKADQRHIHHSLIRLGYTHRRVVYVLTMVHIGMIAMAILLRNSDDLILLSLIVVISTAFCLWLRRALVRSGRL